MNEIPYILGHSKFELRRLTLQAEMVKPITERLLREAGLAPGMRVLDLGCGSGDVTMLAAELVGANGSVVGIDRSREALAFARERARARGCANVEFHEGVAENFVAARPFDLAIGRYVLIHQADPAAFIRAAASQVRPGGSVAFHEIGIYGETQILPLVPLYVRAVNWARDAFQSVMSHPDAGGRMVAHFHHAGLKQPAMFCEILVGGSDNALIEWIALTVRSLLPQIEKIGAATAEEVDIDTLGQRLRSSIAAVNAQILGPRQFCGWARV